jgi:hypothetical protein
MIVGGLIEFIMRHYDISEGHQFLCSIESDRLGSSWDGVSGAAVATGSAAVAESSPN